MSIFDTDIQSTYRKGLLTPLCLYLILIVKSTYRKGLYSGESTYRKGLLSSHVVLHTGHFQSTGLSVQIIYLYIIYHYILCSVCPKVSIIGLLYNVYRIVSGKNVFNP